MSYSPLRMLLASVCMLVGTGCNREPSAHAKASPPPTTRAESVQFCYDALGRMGSCLDDQGFWDAFSTIFFARANLGQVTPEQKKGWIGMRKEDLVRAHRDGTVRENCEHIVDQLAPPTRQDMIELERAAHRSCAEYGASFGWMLFGKGVFHHPRS